MVKEIQVLNSSNIKTEIFISLIISHHLPQEKDIVSSQKEHLMYLNVKSWKQSNLKKKLWNLLALLLPENHQLSKKICTLIVPEMKLP